MNRNDDFLGRVGLVLAFLMGCMALWVFLRAACAVALPGM